MVLTVTGGAKTLLTETGKEAKEPVNGAGQPH